MHSEERLTEDAGHSAPRARRSRQAERAAAAARQSARADDHDEEQRDVMDDRDDGEDERFNDFLDSIDASALPDLPKFDGYHVCWVSTRSPNDRPERRVRMGYEFIKVTDVPGWKDIEGPKAVDGYEGVIQVNEMVAMKISLSLYNRFMRHFHHDEPLAEEEKIRAAHDEMRERAEAAGSGGIIEEGDGTAGIVQRGQGPARFLS